MGGGHDELDTKRKRIVIIGCGPGAPDYVTPVALGAVAQAEVIAGAPRLLDAFARSNASMVPVGRDIDDVLDRIAAHWEAGRRVAVLVSGDPGMCSLAQPVVRRFGRENCEIIPGISSVQVAFARLALDWSEARIVSVHGRKVRVGMRALASSNAIAVLPGGEESWAWIREVCETLKESHRVWLCERLTLPDERVVEVEPEALLDMAPSNLAVVVLVKKGVSE